MENEVQVRQAERSTDLADIRFVRPMDPHDMKRMRAICDDPVNRNFVDELDQMTPQAIIDWAVGHEIGRDDGWEIMMAVVGKSSYVKESEVDRIQGVVNAYTSKLTRARILFGKSLLPPDLEALELVEIVNLRNPHAKPGQMSSGDKKVAETLRSMKGPMIAAAIVEPQNHAGAVTMEVAGFEYVGDAFFPDEDDILEDGLVDEDVDQSVLSKFYIKVLR